MLKIGLQFGASLLLLAPLGVGAPVYYLATGQTGAQTQIDVNHSSSWLFTPTLDFWFGGGLFDMKAGQTAAADTVLSIYQGADATGVLLARFTLANANFCPLADCGQYNLRKFFLPSPVSLSAGTSYFVELTSPAPDTQSDAYFIKSDTYFISDQNGTPIVPSPIGGAAVSDAPEPGSMFLTGLGLIVCALAIRRNLGPSRGRVR